MTDDIPKHLFAYSDESKDAQMRNVEIFKERLSKYIPYHPAIVLGVLPSIQNETLKPLVEGGGLLCSVDMQGFNTNEILQILDHYEDCINQIRTYVTKLQKQNMN